MLCVGSRGTAGFNHFSSGKIHECVVICYGGTALFFFKEEEIWERERCLYRGGCDWPDLVPAVNFE